MKFESVLEGLNSISLLFTIFKLSLVNCLLSYMINELSLAIGLTVFKSTFVLNSPKNPHSFSIRNPVFKLTLETVPIGKSQNSESLKHSVFPVANTVKIITLNRPSPMRLSISSLPFINHTFFELNFGSTVLHIINQLLILLLNHDLLLLVLINSQVMIIIRFVGLFYD